REGGWCHAATVGGSGRPGKDPRRWPRGAPAAMIAAMTEPLYGTPHPHQPLLGPLSPPLVRSSTSAQPDAETLRALGSCERSGEFYQRVGHPNGRAWESLVAAHEGADGAVAFASGMAAISGALAAHCKSGDRVLVAEEIYGGTSSFATTDLVRFGVQVERFSALDLPGLSRALQRPARFVVFESPINPTLRVADVAGIAALSRRAGALTLFDGTFAPPPVQHALALGVDLVVHSATKFYGGHSDVLAGVVAGRHELLGPIEAWRRRTGAVLAPDPAWLLLRSWPTLPLRVAAQQAAAMAVAEGLAGLVREGRLLAVSYPGLPDHPDHALASKQMRGGGCVIALELPGGLPGAKAAYDRLQRIARAPSLGGVESLATLPAFTTHAALSPQQRRAAGIPDGLMRIAVGLEGAVVLLADLQQALAGAAAR
ncbi:MAG: aminotransferase class I/II-fold pyridoxal phosphate-dependent enzyme, partial [Planctomycetota bacterium]